MGGGHPKKGCRRVIETFKQVKPSSLKRKKQRQRAEQEGKKTVRSKSVGNCQREPGEKGGSKSLGGPPFVTTCNLRKQRGGFGKKTKVEVKKAVKTGSPTDRGNTKKVRLSGKPLSESPPRIRIHDWTGQKAGPTLEGTFPVRVMERRRPADRVDVKDP